MEETEYDFGAMEAGATRSHSFIFKNEGQGPLRLIVASTTCQCTVGEVTNGDIAPGQSVPVTLTWTPKTQVTQFRQTANISTNDPDANMRRITLTISGVVTHQFELDPPDMVISQVAGGNAADAQVTMWLYNDEVPEILSHEFTAIATADHFRFAEREVDPARMANVGAKSGKLLVVTLLPGLAVGGYEQQLRLTTNLDQHPVVTIPIRVDVTSTTLIYGAPGADWHGQLLDLGTITSAEGVTRDLFIVPRGGAAGEATSMEIASVTPGLHATLVEVENAGEGTKRFRLTVEVPPGLRPVSHASQSQGGLGEIIVKTHLPYEPEVRILVRFIVE